MSSETTIIVTGDFNAGNRIERLILVDRYKDIFNDFLPLLRQSDIAITNLESPLTESEGAISKMGPAIKALPKTVEALKFAGFNLLTLANNHIMDYGVEGLRDTLDLCKKNNIDFCGANTNLKSASKVLFKSVNNLTLAFINIAENEFSTTNGIEPGANPLNIIANFYSIQEARKSADFVFMIAHGGHEMYQYPSPRMKQTYRFFIDSGADVVIGHHAHCYSGYEHYNEGYIFYNLGNFLFDSNNFRDSIWNYGFAVSFIIEKRKLKYKIFPYEQSNKEPGVRILEDKRKDEFFTNIEHLNKVIADDQMLSHEFDLFSQRVSHSYNAFFEPYTNKFLHRLRRKGILPSFIGSRKRLIYLNLIRCESHRDLILRILRE